MKNVYRIETGSIFIILLVASVLMPGLLISQDEAINPSVIFKPVAFEITEPLRDNPIVEETEFADFEFYMNAQRDREINPDIFPPDFDNMPSDPGEQIKPGWVDGSKATLMNFAGQNSGSYPPDCNGTVGANYYFQVVNTTYAIYNKSTGGIVAGPSPLNSIFNSSLPGAGENDGDPIVLWDEHANRWFYAEFSLSNSNDYMLIAVSQTSDPTGSWYSWSYDVDDTPDYMKFGIWQDGYYMATNTSPGNDVYIFDRNSMIAGNSSPTMIGFDNSWRPSTFDGFHCILPLDNDGPWAPSGSPGQFITIADDGQANAADALYIYELIPNWTTPTSSTFNRVQTLGVNSFSGNFNNSWNNIPQAGTSQTLDGLSTILMFRAQYRNFNGTERIVCAHAIAESSSEAALRWYELENTGTTWSIRQQGTYNPDNISRWNMSIAMNGSREIGIGYSVSNSSIYPGIRYIGQSVASNTAANNTLDISETTLWTGSYSQSSLNRWGDYANISIDPSDDHTFWFTSEYVASSTHGTRIASFQLSSPSSPPSADFSANNTMPLNSLTTVNFSDLSTNNPSSYSWSFSPSTVTYVGSSSTSQNPSVRFNNPGAYTVTLYVQNAYGNDTEVKTEYIHAGTPGLWIGGTSGNQTDWNTKTNWENHMIPTSAMDVSILPTSLFWPVKTGNLTVGADCNSINMASGYTKLTILGDLTISVGKTFYVDPTGITEIKVGGNWTNNGTFTSGMETISFEGSTNSVINTPAGGPVYLINEDFNITWPGNWNGDVAGGVGQFGKYFSNNAGGISPEAAFAREQVNITATRRMNHNPVNTASLSSLTLTFDYSVNDKNSGTSISVDYSTDGILWTNAGWSVPITGNISSTPVSLTLTSNEGVGAANYYIAFNFTGDVRRINYWYIDDVKLFYNATGIESIYNLTIDKPNAKLSTNGNLTVKNDLIIKPGSYFTNGINNTLNVMGTAFLEADNTGIASFIDNGTSTFTTAPIVQQYLTNNVWHYVSNPVSGVLSGAYTGIWLRTFDEPTDSWNANITGTGIPLTPAMKGYAAWAPTNPATVLFNGSLNNGSYSIPVTAQSSESNSGWNLVGNPYPSSLDWDATLGWDKSDIDNTIYYYSGSIGLSNYYYYVGSGTAPWVAANNGTNEIPPQQGFFVHATTNSGTLGVNNNARIHSGQAFYKEKNSDFPLIRIEAEGNSLTDETVIRFVEQASPEFDSDMDAYKLFANDYPQVYTTTPLGTELAISTLPEVTNELVVPVSFSAPLEDTYTFTFTELIGFDQAGDLYLEDVLGNKIVEVDENTVYSFEYSSENINDRFLLHFSNPLGIDDNTGSQQVSIYSYNNVVYISKPENFKGDVFIYDILGKEILKTKALNEGLMSIPITNGIGYYLVKIESDNLLSTKKVFIK